MAVYGKYKLQKIFIALVWILLGSGTIVLLVAAITKRNNEHCLKTNIVITGVQNNFFIDKNDVIKLLQNANGGKLVNKPIHEIDLALMENDLQKDQWIRKAELFFDNNNVLQVRVSEREPVARVFTTSGRSFYLDSSLTRLPLSNKFSARLPGFSSFPTDLIVLTKKDSGLLRQIKTLAEFIGNDPFWMAQIEQIDINPDGTFELIPKIGDQLIHFGNADDCVQKFRKLLTFYQQVQTKSGWNKYSVIDLKYKGQVVGVKRGADEIKMDSLKTVHIMKNIIAAAQKHTNDSTNIQLTQPADDNNTINEHPGVDNIPSEEVSPIRKPADKVNRSAVEIDKLPADQNTASKKIIQNANSTSKKASSEKVNKQVPKPGLKAPAKVKPLPKAIMPAKSDY